MLSKVLYCVGVVALIASIFVTRPAKGATPEEEYEYAKAVIAINLAKQTQTYDGKDNYDPYRKDIKDFYKVLKESNAPIGLVVGYIPNPFYNTYYTHFSAPIGFEGLDDGAYLVSKQRNGNAVYEQYKPAENSAGIEIPAKQTFANTVRQAHGHTHTCANGHTWDHDENPTHTCQQCGLSQFYQDTTPRLVQTVRASPASKTLPNQMQYNLPSASIGNVSGCAGGNCPTATYSSPRRGLGIFR